MISGAPPGSVSLEEKGFGISLSLSLWASIFVCICVCVLYGCWACVNATLKAMMSYDLLQVSDCFVRACGCHEWGFFSRVRKAMLSNVCVIQ